MYSVVFFCPHELRDRNTGQRRSRPLRAYHHSASLLIPSSRVHSCALVCKRFAHMFLLIYQAFYPKNSTCAVCALFFLTFLIYIHIYKTYIKHKNVIYRFYKKKLHKVHTMKILAIYECFLLEIACILTAHRVHTLHTIDDMSLILSVTSCVTAE